MKEHLVCQSLETLAFSGTLQDFIDQVYVESEIRKASNNLKAFIQDEIKKGSDLKSHHGQDQGNGIINCKDKIINLLENQVIFNEDEIRRKMIS